MRKQKIGKINFSGTISSDSFSGIIRTNNAGNNEIVIQKVISNVKQNGQSFLKILMNNSKFIGSLLDDDEETFSNEYKR